MTEEEPEIEKNLKKYLSNTINSSMNKKIFKNEAKIDELMEKSDNIIKLLNIFNKRMESIEKLLLDNTRIDSTRIDSTRIDSTRIDNTRIDNELFDNFIENDEVQKPLQKTESNSNIELLKKMNDIMSNNNEIECNNSTEEDNKCVEKKKVSKVKKQKEILQNNQQDTIITKYIEIKVKHFDIDEKIIKKYLNMNSTNGDIQLFKKMYIENVAKEYIPIRHIKKKFQYWISDHMQDDDTNGEYIVSTVLKNIELCYMKVNNMDNYADDIDQFLKNQEHINRLHDIKYKEKIMALIISNVDI
jgi:hypothetical protein